MFFSRSTWALCALLTLPLAACASTSKESAGATEPELEPTGQPEFEPTGQSEVSADFPFESKFVEVLGSKMHYVDEGQGPAVLLLHGQPTSSYLWRNVIPHISENNRVIAVDLIGFGKSDKPDIGYRVVDHIAYLKGFIGELGIDNNLTLVVHDWGSFLGFDYAMKHQDRIRGIAFMESMLAPIPGYDFWDEQTSMFMQAVRTPGVGEPMIFEQNLFVEAMIPGMIMRELSAEEHDAYRAPFLDPASRQPMLVLPRELPVAGEPADVHALQVAYLAALQASTVPKLHLYGDPGVLNTAADVAWAAKNLPNLTSVGVGPSLHFMQEDRPHEIGEALAAWLTTL